MIYTHNVLQILNRYLYIAAWRLWRLNPSSWPQFLRPMPCHSSLLAEKSFTEYSSIIYTYWLTPGDLIFVYYEKWRPKVEKADLALSAVSNVWICFTYHILSSIALKKMATNSTIAIKNSALCSFLMHNVYEDSSYSRMAVNSLSVSKNQKILRSQCI